MPSKVIAAGILSLGIAAAGWFAGRGFYQGRSSDRFVTVKGVAEREVEADIAVWPLTIVVSDNDLTSAHGQLTRNVHATQQFLGKHGISSDQFNLQGLSVIDTQSNRFGSPTPGNRYTISQTLVVRSDDPTTILSATANVAELVASGVVLESGGPYQAIGPSFIFTRLNELKPEMIAEATARAREAAAKFAQDSGATVGGIRRANQGVFQILARDKVASIDEQHQLKKVVRVVSTIEYFLEK